MNAEELTKLIERLCELGRTGSVLRLLAWVLQLDSVRGMSIVSGLRDQWKPLLNAIPPRRTQTLCKAVQEILSHLPDADLTEFLHDLESADARLWSERRLLGSTSGSSAGVIGGLVFGDHLGIAAGLGGRLEPPLSWQAREQQELVHALLRQLDATGLVYPDTEQSLREYWGRSLGLAYCVAALHLSALCRSRPDVLYVGSLGVHEANPADLRVFKEGGELLKIRAAYEDAGCRLVVLGSPDARAFVYDRQVSERVWVLKSLRKEGVAVRFLSLDDQTPKAELLERYREIGVERPGDQERPIEDHQNFDLLIVEINRLRQLGQISELLFQSGQWHVDGSLRAPRPAPLGPLLDSLNAQTDKNGSPAQQARLLHACDTALRVLLLAHIRRTRESLTEEEILALFLTRPGQVPRGQEWRGRLEWIGDLLEKRIKATNNGRTGQYQALGEQLRRAREILQAGAVDGRAAVDHLHGLLRRLLRLFPGEGSLDGTRWILEEQVVDLSPLLTFDAPGRIFYWEGPAGHGSAGDEFWLHDPQNGLSARHAMGPADLREQFGEGISALGHRLCQSHPQRDTLALHDHFVGRRWLFERLEQRRADAGDAGTVTLLVATAGWGKSAFCAELLRSRGHDLIFFFRNGRQSAFELAKDLEAALSRRLGLKSSTPATETESKKCLGELLEQLSWRLAASGQREWIVVDGLDEAKDPNTCTDWLPSFQNLPAHIDFLFTARIDQEPQHFTKAKRLDVTEDRKQAKEDVREYLNARLGEHFDLGRLDLDLVVSEASEVFLLVKLLCDDVICGGSSPEDMVEALQSGRITDLNSYYGEWWRRLNPAEQPLVLRLLALLCVAEESLPEKLIGDVLDLSYADRLTTYSQVRALLSEQDERLCFLHKTLPDFLQRKIKGFSRDCKREESRLCAYLLTVKDPQSRSDYATRHLATHLAHQSRQEDLWGLLGDPRYLVKRVELDGVDVLLQHWAELTRHVANPPEFLRELYRYLGRAAPAFRLAPESLVAELQFEKERFARTARDTEADFANQVTRLSCPSHLWVTDGDSLYEIGGHEDRVTCLERLSGNRVVSGSDDRTLRIWNTITGECLRILQDHLGRVTCLAVLGESRLVTGSEDRTLRVWNTNTGERLQVLNGHEDTVTSLLPLDDHHVVSGSKDNTVRVWDTNSGELVRTLEGHTAPVRCLAVLRDGRVVSGSYDNSLMVWDTNSGELVRTLEGHTAPVRCLAMLRDGRVVSGSDDNSLMVWNADTDQCLGVLKGHKKTVTCLVPQGDGQVVSGSGDNSLMVWNADTDECLGVPESHEENVTSQVSQGDGQVVSGSGDNSLMVWNADTDQCLGVPESHEENVTNLVSQGDSQVASRLRGRGFKVRDSSSAKCLKVLQGHEVTVTCVEALDDNRVVTGSKDNTVRVWDINTGKLVRTLEGHTAPVRCLAVLSDGSVVSGSEDKTLRVWNTSGEVDCTFHGHTATVRCLAVLSDGRVVSGSDDGILRVWKTSGKVDCTFHGHTAPVRCLAVLRDGRVVSGSDDNSLMLWDPDNENLPHRIFRGHDRVVCCVKVLKGDRLVSGSWDKTLKIWNSNTSSHTLRGHVGRVNCIVALPESRLVVSASCDRTLRLWDAEDGHCLGVAAMRSPVAGIPIASSKRVVACDTAGRLRAFRIGDLHD